MTPEKQKLIDDGRWPKSPKSIPVDAIAEVAFNKCPASVRVIAQFVRAHMEFGGRSLEHAIAGALADTPPCDNRLADALEVAVTQLLKARKQMGVMTNKEIANAANTLDKALAEIQAIAERKER